jgi:hypothetical protein
MGAGQGENGAEAVPVGIKTSSLSNSHHGGIVVPDPGAGEAGNPNGVGVYGNPAYGGYGQNMYANPIAVYNSFRPFVLGIDGSPSPDGQLRGPSHWLLDLGITKETRVTERVGISIFCQMINAFNHTNWNAPFDDLGLPGAFGSMSGGYGTLEGNYNRVIEFGARVSF